MDVLSCSACGALAPHASPSVDDARHPPSLANRLSLTLDVREKARMILAPQRLLDQRAEDHLQAHRQHGGHRHPARQGPRPIQDALRQHEENARIRVSHSAPSLYITCMFYIRYSAEDHEVNPQQEGAPSPCFRQSAAGAASNPGPGRIGPLATSTSSTAP